MIKQTIGWWRVGVVVAPCGVLAGLFLFNTVNVNFEAQSLLAYKGELKELSLAGLPTGQLKYLRLERTSTPRTIRLSTRGRTPAGAVRAANDAATMLVKVSLDRKKSDFHKKIGALQKRQAKISAQFAALNQQRQAALKGSRQDWTPAMAQRLSDARKRHRALQQWPTHTDIPVLAKEIKYLEALQRGQVKIDPGYVAKVSKQIVEARMEFSLVSGKIRNIELAGKRLQSNWSVVTPAVSSRWPVGSRKSPIALAGILGTVLAAFIVFKRKPKSVVASPATFKKIAAEAVPAPASPAAKPVTKIPLELVKEDDEPLPDDPLSRKAAAIYELWLELVKRVYATGPEAPKDIYTGAEPLFKETVAFLTDGQERLTRHVARVVVPGDLSSHVARTVLMALMGAYEAGATAAQQQGMTFAALFHDLAVAPRPADAWHDIGSEVGRLSSGLLRKIPGIPAPLLTLIEEILVAMDEYPLDTWQNVPHNQEIASFAKLLGHIDRFDKLLQKQKTRLARRISPALAGGAGRLN